MTFSGTSGVVSWEIEIGKPATLSLSPMSGISEACDWLSSMSVELRLALRTHGAIFIRGLPVFDVDSFGRVRDVLVSQKTPYREKATPRSDYGHAVYSSTDLPASQVIRMHNENSYTLTFPGTLLFGCLVAPSEGGATPVADVREVLRAMPPQLVERMRKHGWLLTRNYSEYISLDWRTSFAAETAEAVEEYCAENLISCEWQEGDGLLTRQLRPGIIEHPDTGEQVWFNHLAFWNALSLDNDIREALVEEFGWDGLPFNTAFGDGVQLTREELEAVNAAYEAATVRQAWQPGDVMLVDNILAAHGRDPFRGDRKIVVAMGDPIALEDCKPSPTAAPAPPLTQHV